MGRHERRALAARQRKNATGMPGMPTPAAVMAVVTASLADDGPTIRRRLEHAAGGNPTMDDIGSALVGSGAIFVRALEAGNAVDAYNATVEVMWLARALALAAGKVTETPAAEA